VRDWESPSSVTIVIQLQAGSVGESGCVCQCELKLLSSCIHIDLAVCIASVVCYRQWVLFPAGNVAMCDTKPSPSSSAKL